MAIAKRKAPPKRKKSSVIVKTSVTKSRVVTRKKNPAGEFKIYSPENKKYMEKDFATERQAWDTADEIYQMSGMPLEIHHNGKKVASVRRSVARKKNPVKPHGSAKQARVVKAIQLFQRFRVQEPKFVDEINLEFHDVLMNVGVVNAIEYDTVRNGKKEFYRHEFTGKSRPDLAASWDGKQIYIIGGAYNFTDEGIVDFDPKSGKAKY